MIRKTVYCEKNNRKYDLWVGYQKDDALRGGMNALASASFGGLSFEEWYRLGLWEGGVMPYTLFEGERAVSNVFVSILETRLSGELTRCIQLGTVMTAPTERGLGLSQYLLRTAIKDWATPEGVLYLYANDSVTEFYPRFGFREEKEYQYSLPLSPGKPTVRLRRLSLRNLEDRALFLRYYGKGNPFSALPALCCPGVAVFNCLYCYGEDVYWAEDFGAVMIAKWDGAALSLLDVFGGEGYGLGELLSALAGPQTERAELGFTPVPGEAYTVAERFEEDTTFFVHEKGRNPFRVEKLMFPVLSHA